MKRTSWISWRIYFVTLPIDIVILILSGDHEIKTLHELYMWSLIALISHLALAPFIAIGIPQSERWRNWKFDVGFLLLLGIIRGISINLCVTLFDLELTVSSLYKVFNSMIAVPEWFIGVAIFVESHRNYQKTFRDLFAKAMQKEKLTHERIRILPSESSSADEIIARLQFITSNISNDIQKLLSRPKDLSNYTTEAQKIQNLIENEIKPASAELWQTTSIKTPRISFINLARLALLQSRLRILPLLAISIPYLFVGLNGAFGFRIAFYQSLFITLFDVGTFLILEGFYKFKLLNRTQTNLIFLCAGFFLPFFIQLKLIPSQFSLTSDLSVVFFYQLLLSTAFIALLLTLNGYILIDRHRDEVIQSLENLISGNSFTATVAQQSEAIRNEDLANYLHGEVQAGLTASSLLLHQAAKSGDSDLAHEALERASSLLSQDLSNISFTRMAPPDVKIEKIINGWKGIADISVSLPSFNLINEDALRSAVQLIEEAVANSIRHARATDIKITGVLKQEILTITVISNGDPMAKGKAGLGTQMFNDLSDEWSYATESGHNRLTFTLVNHL